MNKENKTQNADFKSLMAQLQDFLELYLVKKAPSLPENAKEMIVKYSPYISLVIMLLALPTLLLFFGLGTALTPFAMMGGYNPMSSFSISGIFSLVALVLEGLAIPGLFSRKLSAWNLVFYASLITAVESLITFNIGNLIIGSGISLYILFQIKSYYK